MKKIKTIVFGGSGFLGSHVADALTEAGHRVIVYDKGTSPFLNGSQEMITGDILDQAKVERAVKGCDYVYNFAGIADIGEASARPLETIKFNIIGNANILEACRKTAVKRYIFASSLYVYSKAGSFYKSTKQACELLIENYFEIYKVPYSILRYGSLYGPRTDEKNFIYKVISQALSENRIIREGDGEEIREYIHVHDAARISVDILANEYKNQCVIISGNQQMKVKDLLLMIKEMLDNKIKIQYKPVTTSYHYEITPYNFAPKSAKRVIAKNYYDLGQGIIELMQTFHAEHHKRSKA